MSGTANAATPNAATTAGIGHNNPPIPDLDVVPDEDQIKAGLGLMFEGKIDRLNTLDESFERFQTETEGSIEDETVAEKATTLVKQYRTALKALEDETVRIARLWKSVDGTVRAWNKDISARSLKNKHIVEAAIGKFLDRKQKEEDERHAAEKQAAVEQAAKELQQAAMDGDDDRVKEAQARIELAGATEKLKETVRSASGTATKRKVEVIEVVGDIDWTALGPFVDPAHRDTAFRKAHKAGVKIAGLAMNVEERTVVR